MSENSRRLRQAALALFCVGALALSACGGSPNAVNKSSGDNAEFDKARAVYDKFAGMEEPERTTALVAAAEKEGKLDLYGSQNLQDYADAFAKKYKIKVTLLDVDNETMVSRLVQEADAGRYTADYVDGAANLLDALDAKKLLGHYDSALRDAIPDEAKGDNWTGNRRQPYLAAYNTDKVSPDEIPSDFFEFADPKWKGKISMELGDYDWYMAIVGYYLDQGKTQAEIDDTFKKIASNSRTADGHSDQAGLLAAGQFAVTMSSYYHHIEGLIEDGAPVTWGGPGKPTVQPIIMRYDGVALTSHAPHPAAATLFLDFVLGPEGSKVSQSLGELPAAPAKTNDPLEGFKTYLIDTDQYTKDGAKWAKTYDALLRNATK